MAVKSQHNLLMMHAVLEKDGDLTGNGNTVDECEGANWRLLKKGDFFIVIEHPGH
jgi:hypothetical protein